MAEAQPDLTSEASPTQPPSKWMRGFAPLSGEGTFGIMAMMNCWKQLLPVLTFLATFGLASAEEKKAQLAYYYLDG